MGTYYWNLDLWAAESGRKILERAELDQNRPEEENEVNKLQNTLNKALGVLQESGVYAFFLYLLAKREKKREEKKDEAKNDPCRVVLEQVLEDFREKKDKFGFSNEAPDLKKVAKVESILKWVSEEIVSHLPRLLLCREFLLRALAYARYAAEAKEVELKQQKTSQPGGSQT
ncbi:MAG: hypothetical protein ACPLTR_04395 [Thermacetogeniaceae bacterium]